jgi:iron(III) transport system substrate-binding protein
MKKSLKRFFSLCLCVSAVNLSGCRKQEAVSNRVVLYCSVDDVYAKPIIKELEKQTGLQIDVLYDTEAAKTAGLANKIRAEKNRPQGDVFWSSALLQTLLLNREGLLQPYVSPNAKDIPAAFKAKDGGWTGLGVRARVIVRFGDIGEPPHSLEDFTRPSWRKVVGISNPQFGTASDWAAALAVRWGKQRTLNYFKALKKNQVRVLPGNSVVAQKVGVGDLEAGVTDSDDYIAQKNKNGEIQVVDDDLWEGRLKKPRLHTPKSINAVLVPGSVALLKNAPHRAAAQKLMDALLSSQMERQLVQTMQGVFPLRNMGQPQWKFGKDTAVIIDRYAVPDDTAKWPAAWDEIREPLAEILLKD